MILLPSAGGHRFLHVVRATKPYCSVDYGRRRQPLQLHESVRGRNMLHRSRYIIVSFLPFSFYPDTMECPHIQTTLTLTEKNFLIQVLWTYSSLSSTGSAVWKEPTALDLTLLYKCTVYSSWTIPLKQDQNVWLTELENVTTGIWTLWPKIYGSILELTPLSTTVAPRVRLLMVA